MEDNKAHPKKYIQGQRRNPQADQLTRFKLEEKEDISTQFAS